MLQPFILLLPLVIALTWVRLIRPGRNRLQGTTIQTLPLPLLARLRMHALPAGLAFVFALIPVLGGELPWWILLAPTVSYLLMVAVPVRYTLTDAGIRAGWTSFRRWTEFAGVRRAPGGARLMGGHKSRGMHIWLSRSRGDDEFIAFLRQTIRNAYKGNAPVTPLPLDRSPHQPGESDQMQTRISAFTADH